MLPSTDLNKVMLVCREWMSIGETCSTLWTWVRARTLKNRGDLKMLQTKRLKLKEIRVTGWNEWKESGQLPELFQALLPIATLTTIHGLNWVDISSIEPQLVSKVMSKLNYLPFHLMKLNLKQLEVLFTSIAQKESKLKKVECWPCKDWFQSDVSKLSPALFVAAVINVEEFDIGAQPDLQPHMQALMEAISEGQTHLKKLNLYASSILISIDPVTLGSAINSMEFVRIYQGEPEAQGGLGRTPLSQEQLTAILSQIVEGDSNLKKLEIIAITKEQIRELDWDLLRQAGDNL